VYVTSFIYSTIIYYELYIVFLSKINGNGLEKLLLTILYDFFNDIKITLTITFYVIFFLFLVSDLNKI